MRWNLLTALITILAAAPLAAQPLTVDQAVATAVQANPAVHAAEARAEAERILADDPDFGQEPAP